MTERTREVVIPEDHLLAFMIGGDATMLVHSGKRSFLLKMYVPRYMRKTKAVPDYEFHITIQQRFQGWLKLGGTIKLFGGWDKTVDLQWERTTLQMIVDSLIHKVPLPDDTWVSHIGICGACGRKLTDPESIRIGIGPVCLKRVHKLAGVQKFITLPAKQIKT